MDPDKVSLSDRKEVVENEVYWMQVEVVVESCCYYWNLEAQLEAVVVVGFLMMMMMRGFEILHYNYKELWTAADVEVQKDVAVQVNYGMMKIQTVVPRKIGALDESDYYLIYYYWNYYYQIHGDNQVDVLMTTMNGDGQVVLEASHGMMAVAYEHLWHHDEVVAALSQKMNLNNVDVQKSYYYYCLEGLVKKSHEEQKAV